MHLIIFLITGQTVRICVGKYKPVIAELGPYADEEATTL